MNNKLFKKLSIDNCFIIIKQFNLYDITIPKNTIAYYSKYEKTWYFCTRFPRNYNGKAENVTLSVLWYDCTMRTIGDTMLKNCDVSIALYESWINASKPHTCKIYHEMTQKDYEQLMHQPSKKKKQTGGVRLSEKSDEYTTDNIQYKQNTLYAYYANLDNAKSGSASMIATSIR